jgi:hypothetical protein
VAEPRDPGEAPFASHVRDPGPGPEISNHRLEDLTSQIDFLDREVIRYRELLEQERIRQSTKLADQQLLADTQLDELRRAERRQAQTLHDSYRSLLSERQVEFEQTLSKAAAETAAELAEERRRYEEMLGEERSRSEVMAEANRQQVIDELNESHQRSRKSLLLELSQATEAGERLQDEVGEYIERSSQAEIRVHDSQVEVTALKHRLETIDQQHRSRLEELEKQLKMSTRRVEAERKRLAATLAELLERSASIAAEADKTRSDFGAAQADAERSALATRDSAKDEYEALIEAADDRASRALVRESELEAVIAELRDLLSRKRQ